MMGCMDGRSANRTPAPRTEPERRKLARPVAPAVGIGAYAMDEWLTVLVSVSSVALVKNPPAEVGGRNVPEPVVFDPTSPMMRAPLVTVVRVGIVYAVVAARETVVAVTSCGVVRSTPETLVIV